MENSKQVERITTKIQEGLQMWETKQKRGVTIKNTQYQ